MRMNKTSQKWLAVALIGTVIYGICSIVIGPGSLLVKILGIFYLALWWGFIRSKWKSKESENDFWDGPEASK